MGDLQRVDEKGSIPDFVRSDFEYLATDTNLVSTAGKSIVQRIRENAMMQAETLGNDYVQLRGEQQSLLVECPLYTSSDSLALNRYRDVIPYAHNRVVLRDGSPSDYINASWVREDGMSYIACQGPLEHTSESFWLMIVEQGVPTVIMLTGLRERGRDKCHGYFPQGQHVVAFGCVKVRCVEVVDRGGVVERNLEVTVRNERPWHVKHYHLRTWPDHGVPDSPSAIYGILDVLYRHHGDGTTSSSPAVVHCSAGIGRTGVLIVLDILRARMSQLVHGKAGNIDERIHVKSIVASIRKQRAGMVQTLPQLKFCIDTLVDMCNIILVALQAE